VLAYVRHPRCAVHAVSLSRRWFSSRQNRYLWRWGASHGNGALESSEPQLVEEARGVTGAACGPSHSAFVIDGRLYTYGSNRHGKLGRQGDGVLQEPGPVSLQAPDGHQPLPELISLGGNHSAVITEGGVLWTWGYGGSFWYGGGALGLGKRSQVDSPEMVMSFVNHGMEVEQVACGDIHTLVLDREGRVHSTGQGSFGRLGRGGIASWSDELDFHEVEYFRKTTDSILNPGEEPVIVKVDAGREFSAAMSAHGEIWVWGRNDYGQLGMGVEVMQRPDFCMHYPFLLRNMPMEGHALRDFACGDHHIVALTSAGAIYEWGDRHHFEPTAITLPSRYQEGLKGIWKVAAGESCSFALSMDGSLYSWGRKSSGCLALGDCEEWVKRPVRIPPEKFGNQRVVDIMASKHHCMAITEKV